MSDRAAEAFRHAGKSLAGDAPDLDVIADTLKSSLEGLGFTVEVAAGGPKLGAGLGIIGGGIGNGGGDGCCCSGEGGGGKPGGEFCATADDMERTFNEGYEMGLKHGEELLAERITASLAAVFLGMKVILNAHVRR